MTLEKAMELNPELAELSRKHEPWPTDELIRYKPDPGGLDAARLDARRRVLITPEPLVEHVPLYVNNKGEVTTQYDMLSCEAIGLLRWISWG